LVASGDADQLAALFLDMLTGRLQLTLLTSTASNIFDEEIKRTARAGAKLLLYGAAAA